NRIKCCTTKADCDDGNKCTVHDCDIPAESLTGAGVCRNTQMVCGSCQALDSGRKAFQREVCQDGVCQPSGPPKPCTEDRACAIDTCTETGCQPVRIPKC